MLARPRPASALLAAALALASLAAACGAPGRPASPAAASRQAAAGPLPARALSPAAKACGPPDAPGGVISVHASDGVRLAALSAGSGPRGVVLVPELGHSGMCGWWDFAARLSRAGYRVLAFDHRCTGTSDCPSGPAESALMPDIAGAVAAIRRAGAISVALVGASQGGSEALIAATRPPPGVAGVAVLSADELTLPLAASPYPRTAAAAVPRLRLPALFAVARGDRYVSVADTRRLAARAGSRDKQVLVAPAGSGHGWDLVSLPGVGGRPPVLAAAVEAFLARATSSAVNSGFASRLGRPARAASLDGCLSTARAVIRVVHDAGGGTLTVAVMGTGRDVVVLSNESDENLCSWLPFAARLTAAGCRVVLWDFGGNEAQNELAGLVRSLRAAGAGAVALMGASEGAKASLVAAAALGARVRGVVSLSAEDVLRPGILVVRWVARLRVPMLLATSQRDPYGSQIAGPEFLRAARVASKRLITVPGAAHGTALLSGPPGAVVAPAVLAFLHQVFSS